MTTRYGMVLLLFATQLWNAGQMSFAGSGTRNGGHGYEIGGKSYSYDLTLNGLQFDPYDSTSFEGDLEDAQKQVIEGALSTLLGAKDLSEDGKLEPVIKDRTLFTTILFKKFAQLKAFFHQHDLVFDLDHVIYETAALRWRYLNIACKVVIDAEDPKDRTNDSLLFERYQQFFPKKIQMAFREKRDVSFCSSFKEMHGIPQQAALVMHEMLYAYLDRHFSFPGEPKSTYEMRRYVYNLVGFAFDPQLAAPPSSFIINVSNELVDLLGHRDEATSHDRLDEIVQLPDAFFEAILPQRNAKLCNEEDVVWTVKERLDCDSAPVTQRYRICAGKKRSEEGALVILWATRFAMPCQTQTYMYSHLGSFRISDETLTSEEKDLGHISGQTIQELCTGRYLERCSLEFQGEKGHQLNELLQFDSHQDQNIIHIESMVEVPVQIKNRLENIFPRELRVCAGRSKYHLIVYATRDTQACRAGDRSVDPRWTQFLQFSAAAGQENHLVVEYQGDSLYSYSEDTLYTKASVQLVEKDGDAPTPNLVTMKHLYQYVGYYDPSSNQLRNLCDGNWTGLCHSVVRKGAWRLDTLEVPNLNPFNAAQSWQAALARKRIKYLVDNKGLNPDLPDSYGRTLLMYAVRPPFRERSAELVRYLLEESRVDVSRVDHMGYSAYDFTSHYNPHLREILRGFGAVSAKQYRDAYTKMIFKDPGGRRTRIEVYE